jgi:pilus assembly protein CpaB
MKGKGPLFIAVVLGLLAALLDWVEVSHAKAAAREGWELKPVVVAAEDIDEGTIISADLIKKRNVPATFVTASVIPPDNFNFIIGQKVMVAVKRGDMLLWTQFESSKGLERLSKAVSKNFRAVTLPVADRDSVGGWIRPNDHVDVLLTYRDIASGSNATITLLPNVVILATGEITGTTNQALLPEDKRHYTNVTVLVLPEEAEILNLAQDVGHVSLDLRNDEDLDSLGAKEKTTLQTLLTGDRERINEQKRRSLAPTVIKN